MNQVTTAAVVFAAVDVQQLTGGTAIITIIDESERIRHHLETAAEEPSTSTNAHGMAE
jgi:hypothetical protein